VSAPNVQANAESYMVLNNGWIYNGDPLVDFAAAGSDAYLARDVVIWGDCVKLRYGAGRVRALPTHLPLSPQGALTRPCVCVCALQEDNPWLWDHMAAYTRKMATIFHAFRIGARSPRPGRRPTLS
jgi:glycogen debranching enzyme